MPVSQQLDPRPPDPQAHDDKVPLRNHPAVSKVAIGGGGAVLFGLPFLATGVFIGLVSTGWVEVDPTSVHAPWWVLGAVGGVFGLAGLLMCGHGVTGLWRRRRLALQGALHPEEPWFADHFWDPAGGTEHGANRGWNLFGVAIVVLFAAIFHGIASEIGRWSWPILILLDLLAAWCVLHTLYTWVRRVKYGRARLRYDRFPFAPGTRLEVTFQAPPGLREFRTLTFTLRQIDEAYETRGTGDNRRTEVVCYQRYHDTYALTAGEDLPAFATQIPVVFELPADAPSSHLAARPARYWELEIAADAPGVDFLARFLLPVYGRPDRERLAASTDRITELVEA